MSDIIEEAIQELFIAITTRWRTEEGVLAIGVPKSKLLKAGEIKPPVLDDLLKKLKSRIGDLGLELVEYLYEGEVWYTIRSSYVAPSELKEDEEAVLAVIIGQMEKCTENPKTAPLAALKKQMVGGKYCTEYQFERILKQLEQLGYIHRKKQGICYGPRTMVEYPEEARKHIAEESNRLIF